MGKVTIERRANVAVLTIDNPPVNAIDHGVRSGLVSAVERLSVDEGIRGIVLIGKGDTFPAGSDVREFGHPIAEPTLPDVLASLEVCSKPLIAAISGQAFGGGYELALACHYRIASESAKVGLPEVNLGLIPGAGGTQRLPRLIGMTAAVDVITSGRTIPVSEARLLGMVDEITAGDLTDEAVDYVQSINLDELAKRRLSSRVLTKNADTEQAFAGCRDNLARKRRGQLAPLAALDALQAAIDQSFSEAIKVERKLFNALRSGEQHLAMQHIFFAEHASGKLLDISRDVAVEEVAVIGGGTMGCGIVLSILEANIPVIIVERSAEAAKEASQRIESLMQDMVVRKRLTAADKNAWKKRLKVSSSYDDIVSVDIVIEAVFENFKVKSEVITRAASVLKAGCIIATNTSYLDVDALADASGRPEQVLGLHFFAPANVMKLMEIVKGRATGNKALITAFSFAKKLQKISVLAGVCHGFIGNRMYSCYQQEAGRLLLEGASPSKIDGALRQWGFAMGPLAVGDLSGLDIGYAMRQSLRADQYDVGAFIIHDTLVEASLKGRKSGAGFYCYDGASVTENPAALEIIKAERKRLGIQTRDVGEEEIVTRCVQALYSEGGRIIAEGVAQKASDIDVVYVNGYGFPRWRGGPMYYGDGNLKKA